MKTTIKTVLALVASTIMLISCSTSDKVTTGNFIQKRKYTGGYFLSSNKKHKHIDVTNAKEPITAVAFAKKEEISKQEININTIIPSSNEVTASISNSQIKNKINARKKSEDFVSSLVSTPEFNANDFLTNYFENTKKENKVAKSVSGDKPGIGLYILAIFIPFVAVGIYTDWGKPTLWNVLWCLLGFLPGIIHAFIILGRGK